MDGASQNGKRKVESVPQDDNDHRKGHSDNRSRGPHHHHGQLVHHRGDGAGRNAQAEETGIGKEIADKAGKAIDVPEANAEPYEPIRIGVANNKVKARPRAKKPIPP